MWLDLILEYLAGFGFGLFIFQSLFMKSMMGGTYLANVRNTFLPEFISMNFMMAGMAPVMSFLMMGRDMRAMESSELLFWGVMSLGVIVGFVTAYPANVWMVARKLKHGLMTVRATRKESRSGREAKSARVASAGHETHREQNRKSHGGHAMTHDATPTQLVAVASVSFFALLVGIAGPANWVNLRLSARDVGGAIMPAGMIMDRDTPAEAMRDMAAVDPRDVVSTYGLDARGDRELVPEVVNGLKIFRLETSVIRWTILPGVMVDAYAFNARMARSQIISPSMAALTRRRRWCQSGWERL